MIRLGERMVVNCGASHLAVACWLPARGRSVRLSHYERQDLGSAALRDETWRPALKEKLAMMLARKKRWPCAQLVIPGCHALTKVIRVPRVEENRQESAIAYEVEQNLPYVPADVLWDTCIFGDDGVELEVLLVAVRSEIVEFFTGLISEFDLKVTCLTVAPVLQLGSLASLEEEGGEVALVDIGARSMDFAVVGDGRTYVRSIKLGGSELTSDLENELEVDFEVAEARKKLTLPEAEPNENLGAPRAEVYRAVTRFSRKVASELIRSLANYRRQYRDHQLRGLRLSGRGALLPGLADHLREKVKLPIGLVDPSMVSSVITIPLSASGLADPTDDLMEIAGSVHDFDRYRKQGGAVNLLPVSYVERLKIRRRRPAQVLAAVAVVTVGFLPVLYYAEARDISAARREAVMASIQPLQVLERETVPLLQARDNLQEQLRELEAVARSRTWWLEFFSDLQERLVAVEDVWLESLQLGVQAQKAAQSEASGREQWEVEFRISGTSQAASVAQLPRLRLTGQMVDRKNPLARVSSNTQRRVNHLLDLFEQSNFVHAVEDQRFDTSKNGILQFSFTLALSNNG